MSITKEKKSELVAQFKTSEKDNGGSAASQVAVLTERIRNLTEHMKNNHKDDEKQPQRRTFETRVVVDG